MDQPVQEQTGSPVPGCRVSCRALSWDPETAKAKAFAPESLFQNTGTERTKPLIDGGRYHVLDSLFLLFGFVTQHVLHDLDLSALTAVDFCREVELLRILSRAGTVKQV